MAAIKAATKTVWIGLHHDPKRNLRRLTFSVHLSPEGLLQYSDWVQPNLKRRKTKAATATEPSPPDMAMAGRTRWFRLLAALGVPVVCLLCCEVLLRILGLGYPTRFLLEQAREGRAYLIENKDFAKRFFPERLLRFPRSINLPQPKSPETVRIFVLGESAAMGDPDPPFGLPRMLQAVLSQRFPASRIEVANAAMVAINSHVILPIAKDCVTRQGDLWVVYMGNNEMIGPFGSVTVLGAQTPPLWMIRAVLGLKTARVLQVADLAWQRLNRPDPNRSEWGGMTMWWGQGVAQDDPKTARVYANFRENLAGILKAAREAGVPVLLCTVATNVKDCAPFASLHRRGLPPEQLANWEVSLNRGKVLQAEGKWQEAAMAYAEAAKIDSEYAELMFRQAQCLLAANRLEEAKVLFRRARDADALQFRTDTKINEIIREMAAAEAGRGVELLDAERLLAEASPQGLPGQEFFYEHVHLTPEGNYQLTQVIAERAERRLAAKLKSAGPPRPWLAMPDCFKHIGLVDWNRHETLIDLLKRVQQPPFLDQANHSNQVAHLREQEARYRPASKSTQVARAARQVVELAKARPDEPDLIWNAAQLLEVAGDFAESERYWRATIQLRPNSDLPRYNLARLLEIRADGRTNEIEQLYRQTIALAPRNHDAHYSLGCFLLKQGRGKEAIPHLRTALEIRPGLAETHLRLGMALREAGQAGKAEEQFRLARKLDPGLSTPQ